MRAAGALAEEAAIFSRDDATGRLGGVPFIGAPYAGGMPCSAQIKVQEAERIVCR